ncbi:RNA polymerase sigma factor [Methylobacillus sp. Pita1]|uniref:RNA polymerase sigma factor n=1 Tax=Methylobacillus sp. Pita1 TaxID=3382642 RepID=UPI0038B4E874
MSDSSSTSPSLVSSLTRHYEDLVDYVRYRFGCKLFAREIVHNVCVHLLEKPAIEARQPIALLKRISHNMAVNECRAESVRNRLIESMAELPENVASGTPDHAARLDAQRQVDLLARAIEALPPRCKQVFIMHKIHDIPQSEVALRLGISVKMVERHTRLGLAACKQYLGRD